MKHPSEQELRAKRNAWLAAHPGAGEKKAPLVGAARLADIRKQCGSGRNMTEVSMRKRGYGNV